MKLALFTQVYVRGGIDTFLSTLINAWPNADDEIILIANADYPGLELIRSRLRRPVTIRYFRADYYESLSQTLPKTKLRKPFMPLLRLACWLFSLVSLRDFWRELDADALMVVNGGHPGADACRAAPVAWRMCKGDSPCVYNVHNLADAPRWFERFGEGLIDANLLKAVSCTVAVSRASALSLRLRRRFAANKHLGYLHNGIEDHTGRPDLQAQTAASALKKELGLAPQNRVCLLLGSFDARKGHDFALEAFSHVQASCPEARLVFCGSSGAEETEHMQQRIARHGLDGKVVCREFAQDPLPLLAGSELLLVASQAFESLPLVAIEAMSLGIPVVSTDVGGLPEVVADGLGGYVVSRDDPQAFAEKMIALLENDTLRTEQGRLARQRYELFFQAETMAKGYRRLLEYSGQEGLPDADGLLDFNFQAPDIAS